MIVWILLFTFALWKIIKYFTPSYDYWEKKGFPYLAGSFPYGTQPSLVRPTRYVGYNIKEIYDSFEGQPCVGIYSFTKVQLMLRDTDLIKNVLVKDFNNFRDRSKALFPVVQPLALSLFSLQGWKWRTMRIKLTPTFTSGKLKLMYGLFQVCAERFQKKLTAEVKTSDGIIDVKDFVSRLTFDIISSCGFGLDMDTINNPKDPFRTMLNNFFIPHNWWRKCKEISFGLFPFLKMFFSFTTLRQDSQKAFIDSIAKTIECREKNYVRRNDFLDLLLDLKNKGELEDESKYSESNSLEDEPSHKIEMDINIIAAQCFIFFLAGFDTSSKVQAFALYELALNQDIQEKVRNEIMDIVGNEGDLSYQSLMEMKYLDQIVNETMRKYPTLLTLTRICEQEYEIPGTKMVIDPGVEVLIPVYALHYDAQYFPNPERFDPDRFSPSNKDSIKPFSYLPFGDGPRSCIGMRFGLLQTKLGIASVLKKFRVLPSPTTKPKIEFFPSNILSSRLKEDLKLKLEAL